jgi:anti-sigma factor RsiW
MNCEEIARLCPLYLSGDLDQRGSLEFKAHLEACHECAVELERQMQLDTFLRDSVLSEAVDSVALEQRVRKHIASEGRAFSVRWFRIAAAMVAMILAGVLGYRVLYVSNSNRLCSDAARDHDTEVTRRQHRTWLSDPQAIANLAQRSGVRGALVTALAPVGYRLQHAKLCRLDGRVFLHLVYSRGAGEFSIYLRPADSTPLTGPVRETVAGKLLHETDAGFDHIASFQTSQLTAVFVTDQSSDGILSVARLAARVL